MYAQHLLRRFSNLPTFTAVAGGERRIAESEKNKIIKYSAYDTASSGKAVAVLREGRGSRPSVEMNEWLGHAWLGLAEGQGGPAGI